MVICNSERSEIFQPSGWFAGEQCCDEYLLDLSVSCEGFDCIFTNQRQTVLSAELYGRVYVSHWPSLSLLELADITGEERERDNTRAVSRKGIWTTFYPLCCWRIVRTAHTDLLHFIKHSPARLFDYVRI